MIQRQTTVGRVNLLTVVSASQESGIPKQTLWNAISKGALPVVRIGPSKIPRIRRSDLIAFLKK
jgi:hypothetical protein